MCLIRSRLADSRVQRLSTTTLFVQGRMLNLCTLLQEQEKSAKLTESMKRLDEEKKKTDELLYQMIPKTVADRLRRGDSAVSTCETFDEVTILFSDICGFTNICGAITPLDVVNMLNNMYSVFDKLTEQNCVYKVETVGDAYMIVSGAPVKTEHHAPLMSEMAQDMIKAIANCKDPSGINPHLMMRIGLHTGMVVAGVVGVKMPRYCLFGDTVNTANKMESSGQPQRIHISATTKTKLDSYEAYVISDGSEVVLPNKRSFRTYFLDGKRQNSPQVRSLLSILTLERSKLQDGLSSDQRGSESWQERASSASRSSHRQHRPEVAKALNGSH
ncbi:hypothetical protein BOX15_Mlig016425g1 [Macrostomum lignano]|uniref:guanylate cyclase n=1 Tax=Macrostomum lignano TaxID=282301 RepID=A0A267FWC8_9PLAT|nr:hypothetical protein BOX15_Mlig016425g1 [Macrostomum lignano]